MSESTNTAQTSLTKKLLATKQPRS